MSAPSPLLHHSSVGKNQYGAIPTSPNKNSSAPPPFNGWMHTRRRSLQRAMPPNGIINGQGLVEEAQGFALLWRKIQGISEGLKGYANWVNVLLVCVPLGIFGGWLKWDDSLVFALNFIGMVPLAMILGKSTEDIAVHTNETIGALANCTFGNAVEVILSIAALRAGRLDVVKNTLVGSVLSNLLLVLGMSFFCGGLFYREQDVLPAVSDSNSNLLVFAVFGFVIPALFSLAIPQGPGKVRTEEAMSLVTAICLLATYGMYLVFQLHTHAQLYEKEDIEAGESGEGFEEEEPSASLPVAIAILVSTVLCVSFCSEFLVDSLEGFSKQVGLGQAFIALVLLPVIGNSVEHFSAVMVAMKDKMDLSVGIACGSSVQIALFAAPVLVLISWVIPGQKLTLNFHLFETFCMCFSVLVVNATLRDSRTNWLEGAVLCMCYVILASAFFFM